MFFNISEIRKSVGDYRLLTSAELRMLIKQTSIYMEQRVELYRVRAGASARYLSSRFVSNQWKGKWLSFDVTETLQEWLKGTGELNNGLVQSFHYNFCVVQTIRQLQVSNQPTLFWQRTSRVSNFGYSVNATERVPKASNLPSLGSVLVGGTRD